MTEKIDAFDFVKAILQSKDELITDTESEECYVPYLTNKALSYHKDCLLYANEMNRRPWINKKAQFDFLINTVRSKKRSFGKWIKPEKNDDIVCVKQTYHCSDDKAREMLRLLTKEQIEKLKEKTDIGGLRK